MCTARYTVALAEEYEYRKAECEEAHRAVHSLKYGDSRTNFSAEDSSKPEQH